MCVSLSSCSSRLLVSFVLTHLTPSDFADEFPDAEVIGTDISPIQPTWIPPNLKLYVQHSTVATYPPILYIQERS